MTRKTLLIGLLSFYTLYIYAQNETQEQLDSITYKALDQRYEGGQKAFFKYFGQNVRFPQDARFNCRLGTLLISLKIRPTGSIDSLHFTNDLELGMGIEDDVIRCLIGTKGKWIKTDDYTTLNFSIAYCMEEDKERPKASMLVVGYGSPSHCPTYQDNVKAFEKAKKKKNYKEAIALCEDLLRRRPLSEVYKKELAELKAK